MESILSDEPSESRAVVEARLLHEAQRFATALLVDSVHRDPALSDAPAELRDFMVVTLRHYHDEQESLLWPQLISTDPAAAFWLVELSAEHDALDLALDRLGAVPLQDGEGRTELAAATATVRDLLHAHLEHEESLLFPALAAQVSDAAWTEFATASAGPGGRLTWWCVPVPG
ncbi:iron-sulfur cluster repair protein YtfE (RIC family) [Streptomyces aurantiacus]|uniref:hemerythrin domain-containing protein n=1 Tax=Streptomyces aurantiacus TaxID=47760 RepID=UPI00278FD455|nr:hemerythrin domain-containing protein [Streptomyces aurantiacus]MDQ0772856.1 iron-sulfur cluster repair protein YtfE (RIC family) [Streptomyces aurantiacus]